MPDRCWRTGRRVLYAPDDLRAFADSLAGQPGGAVDLARLFGVTTKALVRAMKRNRDRFPADFMFQLKKREWEDMKSQTVISSWGGARRGTPYAFTEQGVAMLSSVLNSKRAVRVNVEIMLAFVRLRQVLATNAEVARRLDDLEAKVGRHDEQFVAVIQAIRELMEPPPDPPRKWIGYATEAEGRQRKGRWNDGDAV